MYVGTASFRVCTYCTRMHNNEMCPACGNPTSREFKDTTPEERKLWQEKKYFVKPEQQR